MANSQVNQSGCRSNEPDLKTNHFKWVENGSGQSVCGQVWVNPIFSHENNNNNNNNKFLKKKNEMTNF